MATWKQLQDSGKVRPHKTSKAEITLHFTVVDRNLKDASIPALSDDGRFVMSYQAVYQLATIAIIASGYETKGEDHHRTTFAAVSLGMGASVTMLTDYFDRCRRKRSDTASIGTVKGNRITLKIETEKFDATTRMTGSLAIRTLLLRFRSKNFLTEIEKSCRAISRIVREVHPSPRTHWRFHRTSYDYGHFYR